MTDFDELKHRIRTEWAKLDHAIIATAVQQWRRRLSGCVQRRCAIEARAPPPVLRLWS